MPESIAALWPALVLVLEGHASLSDITGNDVTLEDVTIMSIASDAWADAERRARPKK